jgi:RNA polymerase sigma-70 factor (ECF subfamily)
MSQAVTPLVSGEKVDFRRVFQTEFGWVMRTLRYLGIRGGDLEDVTHDVFLHIYRHFPDYDPARPLRPWLYAFAYRTARDFRALRRHGHHFVDDTASITDPAPLADAVLMRSELQALALEALEALDADERAVFVAHDLDEMAAPEIAAALEIPLNTAYSRLRRARTKFENAAKRLAAKEKYR